MRASILWNRAKAADHPKRDETLPSGASWDSGRGSSRREAGRSRRPDPKRRTAPACRATLRRKPRSRLARRTAFEATDGRTPSRRLRSRPRSPTSLAPRSWPTRQHLRSIRFARTCEALGAVALTRSRGPATRDRPDWTGPEPRSRRYPDPQSAATPISWSAAARR